jgi:hypothetical protein
MFWNNKELSSNEKALQMIKHQTNAFAQLMQAFVLSHTIEILALATVIIISIFIIKQIWQERLGYRVAVNGEISPFIYLIFFPREILDNIYIFFV